VLLDRNDIDAAVIAMPTGTHGEMVKAAATAANTFPVFMQRFREAYAAKIRDFVDCIQNDRAPLVSGPEARAATAIGVAATRSLDEGRPVALSEVN
jgi:predicted dehydrogenase